MEPNDGLPAPFADFYPALQVVNIYSSCIRQKRSPYCPRAPGGLSGTNGRSMIGGQLTAFF
ncbi:hypothetical protein [Sodalis sp.]|uniref:hypothetical protein n=1 Tax=Sodalis sp. (in: enterobacteria) TaxID=1898979 RepID=UPI0038737107